MKNNLIRSLLIMCLFLAVAKPIFAQAEDGDEIGAVNLRDADLGLFIETVADITGRNFIIDPRVKGRVTVISHANLTVDEIYELFLSVLSVHGYVTIPVGNSIKIVPAVNSRYASSDNPAENLESLVTQVFALNQTSAVELVPVLRPLLPPEAHMAAINSNNKLLISTTAFNVQRIYNLVRMLDKPVVIDNEVISLKHAQALEVANIIAKLQQSNAGAFLRLATVVPDEASNTLIVVQPRSISKSLKEIVAKLDQPRVSNNGTQQVKVIYLEYADATKLAPILERVATGSQPSSFQNVAQTAPNSGASASNEPVTVSVQAEPELNALVVSAPASVVPLLEQLVEDLDVRRAQVLVEAIIAEISSTHAAELGMQWALRGAGTLGLTNFSSGNLINLYSNPLSVGSGLTLGVGATNDSGNGLGTILRALSSDAATNIVATPSLVTLDNKEAEIVVGKNVPFITGQYTNSGTSGSTSSSTTNPFQTIKRENVGVKLRIIPKINQGDAITMSIFQEVSSVASQSTVASDVVTNTRTIETNVIANDQDLIVLGGLIDDQYVDNAEKVPVLGDLPIIGGAFRYKTTSITKRNLMVFIKPTIIRDAALLESFSHDKYQYLRAQQVLLNQSRNDLLGDNISRPVLNNIELKAESDQEADLSNTLDTPKPIQSKANW